MNFLLEKNFHSITRMHNLNMCSLFYAYYILTKLLKTIIKRLLYIYHVSSTVLSTLHYGFSFNFSIIYEHHLSVDLILPCNFRSFHSWVRRGLVGVIIYLAPG